MGYVQDEGGSGGSSTAQEQMHRLDAHIAETWGAHQLTPRIAPLCLMHQLSLVANNVRRVDTELEHERATSAGSALLATAVLSPLTKCARAECSQVKTERMQALQCPVACTCLFTHDTS